MTETKIVKYYIAGQEHDVRESEATFYDDQRDKAFLRDVYVVCKFRYGKKLHTAHPCAWLRPNGMFEIHATQVVHNKRARVLGFKDSPEQTNSGWTG